MVDDSPQAREIEPKLCGPTPRSVRIDTEFPRRIWRPFGLTCVYALSFVVVISSGAVIANHGGTNSATAFGRAAILTAIPAGLAVLVSFALAVTTIVRKSLRRALLRDGVAVVATVTRRHEEKSNREWGWIMDYEYPVGGKKLSGTRQLDSRNYEWYPRGRRFTVIYHPRLPSQPRLYVDLYAKPGEVMPASYDR